MLQNNDSTEYCEKNDESLMLSHCVHELKTPLQTLTGTIELLKETDLTSEQKEYVDHLEYGAEILNALTKDLLDFSKIQLNKLVLEKENFDVKSLFWKSVNLISVEAFKKNLEIVSDIDYSVPDLIEGDAIRVQQILLNILGNALKFTKEGYIHAELINSGNGRIIFRVTDSGIGIREENRSKIFENYFQENDSETLDLFDVKKYPGTGLGLPICKGLVNLMGGKIKCDKNPFGGSIFEFEIPFKTIKESTELLQKPPLPSDTKILIIKSSKLSAGSLEKKLKALGLENVHFAGNAKEAFLTMEYAANLGFAFSVVFIDMHMPIYDGWTLAKKIRSHENPEISKAKLFMLVKEGNLSQRARNTVKDYFEDFIYEPVNIIRLGATLKENAGEVEELLEAEENESLKEGDSSDSSSVNPGNEEINGSSISENNGLEEQTVFEGKPETKSGTHSQENICAPENQNPQRKIYDDITFLKGKKVLIAEDDSVNRSILKEFLAKFGCEVLEASNGEEVLKKTGIAPDFEAIFLDLNMPALDGRKTARLVREIGYSGPLVSCTAENAFEIKDSLKNDGFNYALQKPFKVERLHSLLLKIEESKNIAKRRNIWDYIDFEDTINRDEALGKKLLSEFLLQGQHIISGAQEASARNDFSVLKNSFHKLKGSAKTISHKQIASLCETLEDASDRGDTPLLDEKMQELRDAFWLFRAEAENWKLRDL